MRRVRVGVVVVVLLLVLPLASAGWRVHGSFEPDTQLDAEGEWMFKEPNTSDEWRVYFNAVGHMYITGLNPNSDLTGSRVNHYPFQYWAAYLGVWMDCNGDGYVGSASGALSEYRSEGLLLGGLAACASGSAFNDGAWVREFLWIAPSIAEGRPGVLVDSDVLVWGDRGLPGEPLGLAAECEVLPLTTVGDLYTAPPRGTTASTGGMLRYADCFTSHRVARAINDHDATGLLGFEDPEHPETSSSPLNQRLPVNLFGDPYAPEGPRPGLYDRDDGEAAFTVWDCETSTGGVLPGVAPQVHDPAGSYYHGLNDTEQNGPRVEPGTTPTVTSCRPDASPDGSYGWVSSTHPSPEGGVYVAPELQGKKRNDVALSYQPSGVPVFQGPDNAGVDGVRFATLKAGPGWAASGHETEKLVVLDRGTLDPSPAVYWTFYAGFGGDSVARGLVFPSGSAIYGAEWCSGVTSGVSGGFDCDPDAWYVPHGEVTGGANGGNFDADGDGRGDGARPGAPYRLRDVDCFDNRPARDVPVQASLVACA